MTIASGQTSPSATFLDSGLVYWTTSGGEVWRADVDGNGATMLISGELGAAAIAVDPSAMYWVDYQAAPGGEVRKAGLDGASDKTFAAGQINAGFCVIDAGHLYWTTGGDFDAQQMTGTPGAVMRVDKDGQNLLTIASNEGFPSGLAVDSASVYWVDYSDGTVRAAPIGGGAITTLAKGQAYPVGIAIDDEAIYWTNMGNAGADASVMKLAR